MSTELVKELAAEQLVIKALEVLTISDGDLIVIKVPESRLSDGSNDRIASAIQAFVARRQFQFVSVVCIPQDVDIRSLHPAAMKSLGWEKPSRLSVVSSLPTNGNGKHG